MVESAAEKAEERESLQGLFLAQLNIEVVGQHVPNEACHPREQIAESGVLVALRERPAIRQDEKRVLLGERVMHQVFAVEVVPAR